MGYDLKPKNKATKEITVGAFSWPIILQETGAGYVLGYGQGRSPATYVYQTGNNGSPGSNDGYKVTKKQAEMMATVIRGYVSVQRHVNKEWEALPEDERKSHEQSTNSYGNNVYRCFVHEDRLKQMENIAEFFEQSKGFSIH
jgi:hypothetical protein